MYRGPVHATPERFENVDLFLRAPSSWPTVHANLYPEKGDFHEHSWDFKPEEFDNAGLDVKRFKNELIENDDKRIIKDDRWLLSISDVRGQVLFFGSLQGPLGLVRGWKILVMW